MRAIGSSIKAYCRSRNALIEKFTPSLSSIRLTENNSTSYRGRRDLLTSNSKLCMSCFYIYISDFSLFYPCIKYYINTASIL